MNHKEPLYNTRIIRSYVEYLNKYIPEIDIESVLKYAGIEKYQLDDEGHWLTQEQIDRFHDEIARLTNYTNIARAVGRFAVSSASSGALGRYMAGLISPAVAYSFVEKINSRLSRAAVLKTKSTGRDEIEVKASLMPDVDEKPYQCEYRLGGFEALAKLFTRKFASIEHPVCIHKGGDCCLYKIRWEKTPVYYFKKIRNYSFVVAVLSIGLLQPSYWDILIFSCFIISLGATLYSDYLEKKELYIRIGKQGEESERHLDEIEKRYNESILVLEIGQTISMIQKTDKLIARIMEFLEKRLDFDRGMVMLEDNNKACLTYLASYGYNPKDENYLKSIEFHLDNPASKGPAIQVFKNQIPVLVNDVTEIEKNLSKKSLEFLHNMNSRSFICVPIVYKMEAMGILMADNVQSKKRLSQTDMNLLAGVAQQIGIGIKNAVFYQRITESEERFRALSENSPDIIYMLDNRGMFTYVNPAWKRILGHEKEEVIGKSLTDFTKKEDENVLVSGLKDIGDRGRRIYGYNGSILHKDGSERMFLMSGAPNTDSGGRVTGIVGTFKDITDLKRAEDEKAVLEEKYRQAQKMEAIGQLAGGVAHDFNNMLNVVIGYSQLALMNMEPSDPLYKNIQEIINAGERSADLVRQLLSFARKQTIAPKAMNLNTAVSGTLNMLRKLIGEGIEIIWQPAPDLRLVTMDPAQMDQLLTNLIVNARDSISSVGRITIKTGNAELHESNLTQQTDPLPGHYVMLSVADNGCGMDRETLEKIFDPFFTTKEVGKGTGMGLATVYGIVKQNKGVISVSSKPGMGTEFKIYLPMRKESEISAAAGTASREGPLIGRETVLFVEDNEAVLKVSKTMLEKLGYTVVATRSPGEAVQLAERYAGDIHLLVTDIIMPEMNGYDLKKQISGIRPGIRCLFISGYTDNKVVNEDVHDGKAHFLQKPFFMNDLAEKVREALR